MGRYTKSDFSDSEKSHLPHKPIFGVHLKSCFRWHTQDFMNLNLRFWLRVMTGISQKKYLIIIITLKMTNSAKIQH